MSNFKIPTIEEHKELDTLMTYILDEMISIDDKHLIREAIIIYANKWHEIQIENSKKNMLIDFATELQKIGFNAMDSVEKVVHIYINGLKGLKSLSLPK